MADLRARDRGQLILVGGFVIAVTFVALALILNSVIFTENLATRGESVGGTGGVEARDTVSDGVAEVMAYANARNNTAEADPRDSVRRALVDIETATSPQYAVRGRILEVTYADETNGTRIAHNDSTATFTAANGKVTWVADSSATQIRDFGVNVTQSSLKDASPSTCMDCFGVEFSDGVDTWTVAIYDDGSEVAVTTYSNDSPQGTCTTPGPRAEVNITSGMVGDEKCQPMLFGEGLDLTSDLIVRMVNGDRAQGRYSFVTDSAPSSLSDTVLNGPGSTESPRKTFALYSTDVVVGYQTGSTNYNATVRVAPGEPR